MKLSEEIVSILEGARYLEQENDRLKHTFSLEYQGRIDALKENNTLKSKNLELKKVNTELREIITISGRAGGFTYKKIADFMGVSVETIRQRFRRLERYLTNIENSNGGES
jgi:DNA-directed RNA polymerase specialized sigma24 family protein